MGRPAGVTVSAVFLILVSLVTALMGAAMLFARFFVPPTTPQPPFLKAVMVITAAVFFGSALWGVLTAVGLFRMRRWGRTSILVIGALLVFFCGLSLVMLPVMSMFVPELESTGGMSTVMGFMMAFYLIPILLGLWWLIYFNRAAVKAVFLQRSVPDEGPRQPLSIAVIAWHAVVFGIVTVPLCLSNWRAYIFGILLTGWPAKLAFLVIGAAELIIGAGLLKLKPWSHTAAVWFCIYTMVQCVVFAFLPNKAARMEEMMKYYPPEWRADPSLTMDVMFWFGAVFSLLTFATVLWYLFTRKKAFLEAGKAAQAAA
jgi:hypothetical protein